MNELLQPYLDTVIDNVPVERYSDLVFLLDQIDEYEAGDFSQQICYIELFSAIRETKGDSIIRALSALLKIVSYCNRLKQAALVERLDNQGD